MPADSLLEIAQRACVRYSSRITDIGELRYELIRPVLLKIESPEKLLQIEQNSPQLQGKVGEIWLNFIKRDIPDWQTKRHEPKDPKNWSKVYRKLKKEAQMDISQGEDKLKAALANIQSEKAQNLAQLVSRQELPRPGVNKRQHITYNYISGKTGSRGAHKMSLMERIKKEGRDARAAKMGRPMHELQKRSTPVVQAPQRFVQDLKQKPAGYRQAEITPIHRPARPPLAVSKAVVATGDASYDLVQDREARLRALKAGKSTSPRLQSNNSTPRNNGLAGLTSDFLEDLEDDEPEPQGLTQPSNRPPRMGSPMRISSPQVAGAKRKAPPTVFMSPAKKVAQRPGIS